MLDIVHYLFESDSIGEKEEQDAKTRMRRSIYGQLYKRPYTWGSGVEQESADGEWGSQEVGRPVTNDGAPVLTHKPYVPPTPVNAAAAKPFGNVLDAPLG
jgi:hypothetical protein